MSRVTLLAVIVLLQLPRVAVKGGRELHRRMQAACEEAAEAGRAALRAVSLAELHAGNGAERGSLSLTTGGDGRRMPVLGDWRHTRLTRAVLC